MWDVSLAPVICCSWLAQKAPELGACLHMHSCVHTRFLLLHNEYLQQYVCLSVELNTRPLLCFFIQIYPQIK